MILLLPNTQTQTISILPRSLYSSATLSLNIRRDGDGVEETITSLTAINTPSDYVEISFASTILTEDSTYYIEITADGGLWYRDKIYSTSQTKQDIKTEKHEILNGTLYKEYSKFDDNTYII